jgi:hypothetical protein
VVLCTYRRKKYGEAKRTETMTAEKQANKGFYDLSRKYHTGLPVAEVNAILEANGFRAMEEAIYCGRDGRSHEQVSDKRWVSFSWHRMEVTGQYEVTVYVS